LGVQLVDVEQAGPTVRVVVEEPGGIGTERLAQVTQVVSRALDESDPVPGRYTLEVSSPGVERNLRTPSHFGQVVGQKVSLRDLGSTAGGSRRLVGELVAADDAGVVVRAEPDRVGDEPTLERVPYDRIDKARTVFEWGPSPKPGKGSKPGTAKRGSRQQRKTTGPSRPDTDASGASAERSEVAASGGAGEDVTPSSNDQPDEHTTLPGGS
jgi:ribosome maturation factor RimP